MATRVEMAPQGRAFTGLQGSCAALSGPVQEERSVAAHFCAQACDRLAVQLANPGFGDTQHGGNFLEVHVMFVVHAHDVLFALGQRLYRRNQ